MRALIYSLSRPFLETALDSAFGFARLPLPTDEPRVHAVGPSPDRLLLMGTAAVAGVGVFSHQLGLGGHLARRVSALTGRGVDLEIEGSITFTLRDALRAVTDRSLGHHDAVVLYIGSRESIGLLPIRAWKMRLRALLEMMLETDAACHVFLVGTPPLAHYASLPTHFGDRIARHVDRQNAATAEICAETRHATFIPLQSVEGEGSPQVNSSAYERWGAWLAGPIAAHLNRAPHRTRTTAPVDESSRQAALDSLDVLDSADDARIDRIARTTRDLLGASGASVTFLDHDRQWIKSAVSMSRHDTARATSFCNTTIRRAELFVVEDAAADNTFASYGGDAAGALLRRLPH
jgi:hypothetical protein